MLRMHVTIKGHVQGVGYRAFVQRQASALMLSGWVRNRSDGSVEVLAEGEKVQLDKLLASLRRGPSAAYVDEANPVWIEADTNVRGFHIRPTE